MFRAALAQLANQVTIRFAPRSAPIRQLAGHGLCPCGEREAGPLGLRPRAPAAT